MHRWDSQAGGKAADPMPRALSVIRELPANWKTTAALQHARARKKLKLKTENHYLAMAVRLVTELRRIHCHGRVGSA